MSFEKPHDYTPERAFKVYSRNEYTRWAIQSGLLGWPTPEFQIGVVVVRTNRKYRQRRRAGRVILCIFLFGYEDEPHHWLGYIRVDKAWGSLWWKILLTRIRYFYLEGQFRAG